MKVLAIDTAMDVCGVALAENDSLVADGRLYQKNVHNERLIAMIETLLQNATWQLSDLQGIALSIGPGSFTGLRIGASVAKGLAYSLEIPVVEVNSLDVLATGVRQFQGKISAMMKARENEAYFALYESDGRDIERISDYKIVLLEELKEELSEKTWVVSHPVDLLEQNENDFVFCVNRRSSLSRPSVVAELGYEKFMKNDIADLESFEPFYMKEFIPKRKVYKEFETGKKQRHFNSKQG